MRGGEEHCQGEEAEGCESSWFAQKMIMMEQRQPLGHSTG